MPQKIVGLGASGVGVTATGGSGTTGGARQDSGDDGSLEDPDELWGKDKEQKEEHHEGEVRLEWWAACAWYLPYGGSCCAGPLLCQH